MYTAKDGEVIFKKYSSVGELGQFAASYAQSLFTTSGQAVLICDRDTVITCAGVPKKDCLEKNISSELDQIITSRQIYKAGAGETKNVPVIDQNEKYYASVVAPIVCDGDVIGGVIFLSPESGQQLSEVELKLAQSASDFLGRHMEA
ncbi:MAG: stage V sporulation protein T [Bacteroidia bacterium]|nr:stage V sporulation protein T [Bacteroidia bacterium]